MFFSLTCALKFIRMLFCASLFVNVLFHFVQFTLNVCITNGMQVTQVTLISTCFDLHAEGWSIERLLQQVKMHHCLLIHADNLKGHNNTLRFLLAVSSSPSLWHGSLLNGLTAKDYRKALCVLPNISMLCMRIVYLCFSYHLPTFHRLGNSLFSNLPWNQQQFISLSRIHRIVIDRNNSWVAEFIRFILSDRHRFS